LRSKGQRSRSLERKCKTRFFAHIRQQWIDRFTSNQDQNDQLPILHISSNTFHQPEWFVFMIICNQ